MNDEVCDPEDFEVKLFEAGPLGGGGGDGLEE